MLTPNQIAKDLEKHPRTIYRWIRSNILPATKFNEQYFIKEDDYYTFIKSKNGILQSQILTQKEKENND